MGGEHELDVDFEEGGLVVNVYGVAHGNQELCVPMNVCQELSCPNHEAYMNLARFQSSYITPEHGKCDAR